MSLTAVGIYLTIAGNEALRDVNGLAAVTSADRLIIHNNATLESLAGLASLEAIPVEAWVRENDALVEIGLASLSFAGSLYVYDNPSLAQCLVDEWALGIEVIGDKLLEPNDPNAVCDP
jgi:hypothetical protein